MSLTAQTAESEKMTFLKSVMMLTGCVNAVMLVPDN